MSSLHEFCYNASMYLDHSATSFPKPQELFDEILRYQNEIGGSPGRGAHRASDLAAELVYDTRRELASLFSVSDPERILFTSNATEALNLALLGLLHPGDHVVATCLDHNSVVRPLHHLQETRGVKIDFVPCSPQGEVDPSDIAKAVRPETRLVVLNHASNVTGSLVPLQEIGARVGSVPVLVDATQTAGLIPLDVNRMNIALLAFTGHKSLYGPTGIGGLYVREDQNPNPLKWGGTGSRSENPDQPDFLPDRYESGTPNMLGIAGLKGSLGFLRKTSLKKIRAHEQGLMDRLLTGLGEQEGLRLYGPENSASRTGTLSINLKGWEPSELAFLLDEQYGIRTRSGLHCSPLVHRCIGTFPLGTLRISLGYFNTPEQINELLEALKEIRSLKGPR